MPIYFGQVPSTTILSKHEDTKIIVVDTSGSMADSFPALREMLRQLFREIGPYFLINFSSSYTWGPVRFEFDVYSRQFDAKATYMRDPLKMALDRAQQAIATHGNATLLFVSDGEESKNGKDSPACNLIEEFINTHKNSEMRQKLKVIAVNYGDADTTVATKLANINPQPTPFIQQERVKKTSKNSLNAPDFIDKVTKIFNLQTESYRVENPGFLVNFALAPQADANAMECSGNYYLTYFGDSPAQVKHKGLNIDVQWQAFNPNNPVHFSCLANLINQFTTFIAGNKQNLDQYESYIQHTQKVINELAIVLKDFSSKSTSSDCLVDENQIAALKLDRMLIELKNKLKLVIGRNIVAMSNQQLSQFAVAELSAGMKERIARQGADVLTRSLEFLQSPQALNQWLNTMNNDDDAVSDNATNSTLMDMNSLADLRDILKNYYANGVSSNGINLITELLKVPGYPIQIVKGIGNNATPWTMKIKRISLANNTISADEIFKAIAANTPIRFDNQSEIVDGCCILLPPSLLASFIKQANLDTIAASLTLRKNPTALPLDAITLIGLYMQSLLEEMHHSVKITSEGMRLLFLTMVRLSERFGKGLQTFFEKAQAALDESKRLHKNVLATEMANYHPLQIACYLLSVRGLAVPDELAKELTHIAIVQIRRKLLEEDTFRLNLTEEQLMFNLYVMFEMRKIRKKIPDLQSSLCEAILDSKKLDEFINTHNLNMRINYDRAGNDYPWGWYMEFGEIFTGKNNYDHQMQTAWLVIKEEEDDGHRHEKIPLASELLFYEQVLNFKNSLSKNPVLDTMKQERAAMNNLLDSLLGQNDDELDLSRFQQVVTQFLNSPIKFYKPTDFDPTSLTTWRNYVDYSTQSHLIEPTATLATQVRIEILFDGVIKRFEHNLEKMLEAFTLCIQTLKTAGVFNGIPKNVIAAANTGNSFDPVVQQFKREHNLPVIIRGMTRSEFINAIDEVGERCHKSNSVAPIIALLMQTPGYKFHNREVLRHVYLAATIHLPPETEIAKVNQIIEGMDLPNSRRLRSYNQEQLPYGYFWRSYLYDARLEGREQYPARYERFDNR